MAIWNYGCLDLTEASGHWLILQTMDKDVGAADVAGASRMERAGCPAAAPLVVGKMVMRQRALSAGLLSDLHAILRP